MLEFRKKYEINYQDVDYMGTLKLSHLLDAFSNVATTHAIDLAVWKESMIDDYGWILSKMHLEISQPIKAGQFEIKTYPGHASKVIFPRFYQLLQDNTPIIKASSIWTLLDLKRRRITMPKRAGIDFPDVGEDIEEIDLPIETNEQIAYTYKETRQVRYSDVDTNQHMNNARYLEWACDLIDYHDFKDHFVHIVDIFFKHEIAPMALVDLYYFKDNSVYYIKGVVDETECFSVKIEMAKQSL